MILTRLLQRAADSNGGALAAVDHQRSLTYAELEIESNRLSHALSESGVRRGDRVGLLLDKSVDAVVGVYGIMKAGAAYVPLDPNAPSSRTVTIGMDCDINVLVTSPELADRWLGLRSAGLHYEHVILVKAGSVVPTDGQVTKLHIVDSEMLQVLEASSPAVENVVDRDLAYILYTSGSTGRPKGVTVTHSACFSFVDWAVDTFSLRSTDRFSQFAPFIFDLSTFDLFACSHVAGELHLATGGITMFPSRIKEFLAERQITVVYAVPSLLGDLATRAKLDPGSLPSLRTVLFAGEVFPPARLALLMQALPHAQFANLYGPTETNVCTYYIVEAPPDPQGAPVSIGRTIRDDEGYVVGEDGLLAAPGEVGELYIRGATLMSGYWADPERTSRVLLPNPFRPELLDPVYRTGDLVVEGDDGNYRLIGRRDHQVKRRGYRIELGEIESALLAQAGVEECAVTAVTRDGITERIVAHIAGPTCDPAAVLRQCATRLPRYMLPDSVELLTALPRTATGKIDRQNLLLRISDQGV